MIQWWGHRGTEKVSHQLQLLKATTNPVHLGLLGNFDKK